MEVSSDENCSRRSLESQGTKKIAKFLRWYLSDLFLFFSQTDREDHMKSICHDFDRTSFQCYESSSEICIHDFQKCDGIANCPKGEDEYFSDCNFKFSSLATVKCPKINIFNLNVTIKAVPCDGKIECRDRRDEILCSLEDYIEIVISLAISVIIMAATFVMKRAIRKNRQPIDRNQTLTEEEFRTLHGKEELKTKMHQIQSCESAKRINQQFASWEIDQHDGNTNETVLCIKVKSALLKSNLQSEK